MELLFKLIGWKKSVDSILKVFVKAVDGLEKLATEFRQEGVDLAEEAANVKANSEKAFAESVRAANIATKIRAIVE